MTTELYEQNRERAGFTISETKKGLKLSMWSAYWDTPDFTFYVEETERFNRNTDFSAKWNEIYPCIATLRLGQWKIYKYLREQIPELR